MAIRPCARCHKRYVGRANYFYPAVMTQPEPWRGRYHLCHDCYLPLMKWVDEHMALINLDAPIEAGDSEDMGCVLGHALGDDRITVFLTTYPSKDVRADYFGESCEAHAKDVMTAMGYHPLTLA